MKVQILTFLLAFTSLFSQNKYEEGERYYSSKKFTEAASFYSSIYKKNPSDALAIERLGDVACENKNWLTAKNYYVKLLTISPNNANYRYKYGGALGMYAKSCNKLKALSLLDDIEGSFLKAIVLDSKHIDARRALVTYYLELPGIVGGSVSKAKAYAKELSQLSVKDGQWANAQIEAYLN